MLDTFANLDSYKRLQAAVDIRGERPTDSRRLFILVEFYRTLFDPNHGLFVADSDLNFGIAVISKSRGHHEIGHDNSAAIIFEGAVA